MVSAAERKRAFRERQRQAGVKLLQVPVSDAELSVLRALYKVAGNGDSFECWLKECLVCGAAFRANSGGMLKAGSKVKRDSVTGGFKEV